MNVSQRSTRSGIALVVTLAILVIATILVVGFVSSMRTERHAATAMASSVTTEIIAESAIDHAISLLSKNIPQPVPPSSSTANPTNWIINPGLLTTIQGSSTQIQIPLSSNPSFTYPTTNEDAELNVRSFSGLGHTILSTSAPMKVAWIPVLKDPTTSASKTNPITARYGFWIDDESAKINLNTAYGKPAYKTMDFKKLTPGVVTVGSGPSTASYALGHPSSVNLDVLNFSNNDIDAPGVAAAVGTQAGLIAPDQAKAHLTQGDPAVFFNANKFFLTTFSRDPEFSVFGKSKLYLFRRIVDGGTGNTLRPIGRPLIQPFRDFDAPMYFHGDEAPSADPNALYYTAASLAGRLSGTTLVPGVLSRNDWPGMPIRSFVDKWDKDASGNAIPGLAAGEMGRREADQVAWNMVVMGSFADYSNTYNTATSGNYATFENKIAAGQEGNPGTVNYPNAALPVGPLSGRAIVPSFPRPLINEVCLTILLEPNLVSGVTKYRLKVWLQTELWLGPGYPSCDFAATPEEVGLTYLEYAVTQDNNLNPDPPDQKDTKYIKAGDPDGIRSLFGTITNGTLPDNSASRYAVVTTQGATGGSPGANKWIYVRNGNTGFSSSTTGMFNFEPTGMLHLNFKMRLFLHSPAGAVPTAPPCSLVPVSDTHDPATLSPNSPFGNMGPPSPVVKAFKPTLDDPKDYIEFRFDLDPAVLGGQLVTRSLEVADPRLGGLAKKWQKSSPDFDDPTIPDSNTLGAINNATVWDTSKFAYVDFSNPAGTAAGSNYRPSIGMFSFIPTGMQRGIAGSSLKLQPSGSNTDLPDWLLLDVLSPTADAGNYPNLSFMNSTAGKINLNATIFPAGNGFSPPRRWQPLQAVFQNMSPSSTVPYASITPSSVVENILNHALANPNGVDFGVLNGYDYLGEVCEIAGVADTGASDWDKEAIIRYVASNLTTKSNVFSVWGVAQTVKKNPANSVPSNQGKFETRAGGAAADDIITGEKRFRAVVERYVWPGADAAPGNAHVNTSGSYDRLASGQSQPGYFPGYSGGTWESLDGPEPPTYPLNPSSGTWNQSASASYANSSIENARNPLRALMKYRVVYLQYLTE